MPNSAKSATMILEHCGWLYRCCYGVMMVLSTMLSGYLIHRQWKSKLDSWIKNLISNLKNRIMNNLKET